MIRVERIYDYLNNQDNESGYTILVDRLWPRGLSKDKIKINLWLKDIAPSNDLRKWFNHDPEKWQDFKNKYREELANDKAVLLHQVKQIENEKGTVILLYSAKDEEHNNAVALSDILDGL